MSRNGKLILLGTFLAGGIATLVVPVECESRDPSTGQVYFSSGGYQSFRTPSYVTQEGFDPSKPIVCHYRPWISAYIAQILLTFWVGGLVFLMVEFGGKPKKEQAELPAEEHHA